MPVHVSSNVSSFFDYNAFNVSKSQKRNWNSHLHVAAQTSGSWAFGKRRAQDKEALLQPPMVHLLLSLRPIPASLPPFCPFINHLPSCLRVFPGAIHSVCRALKSPTSRTSSLVLPPAWVSELTIIIMK